ncbi:MAG: flagellar biosynthesis anti-sigma factor FlgM [Candidatus Marinimicrobia bacterium]|nr:flagellar biosynthesis anti-sigma factor FlgM [Candidatus Neomarinimicrobiota bacterium]
MAPIHNIGGNIDPADRIRQQDKLQSSKSDRARQPVSTGEAEASAPKDSVNISPAAKELAAINGEVARAQAQLKALGQEDPARVEAIRDRIESGEFDEPEVSETVAGAIARLPQFSGLLDGPVAARSEERADLALIGERIKSGEFNSAQVLEQVAANILSDIGAF